MIDREQLRTLVRDVIREALAEGRRPPAPGAAPTVEPAPIASDADLDAFVRRIAGLMRDPASAARIEAGTLRFTLGERPGPDCCADSGGGALPASSTNGQSTRSRRARRSASPPARW